MSTATQNLLLAFVAVGAFALLLQTIFLIALLAMVGKAAKRVKEEMEQYRSVVMPLVLKLRDLAENIAPRIEDTANDLTDISKRLRLQAAEIQSTANDILDRTRQQANRVDSMVTSLFDRVERAGVFVTDSVARPMRQFTGIIASVKAAVETFIEPHTGHRSPTSHSPTRYDGESLPEPRNTGTTGGYHS